MTEAYRQGFMDKMAEASLVKEAWIRRRLAGMVAGAPGYFSRLLGGNVGPLETAMAAIKGQRKAMLQAMEALKGTAEGAAEIKRMTPTLNMLTNMYGNAARGLKAERAAVMDTRLKTGVSLAALMGLYGLYANSKKDSNEKRWFNMYPGDGRD